MEHNTEESMIYQEIHDLKHNIQEKIQSIHRYNTSRSHHKEVGFLSTTAKATQPEDRLGRIQEKIKRKEERAATDS